ncbi:telomerase-binding protein EST1A-like [Physella acuta]|uniref:telomerase-binding protein EST1A-like n=1 Tax=Physella acuta TaxID=109671 RepID=UPI0027DD65EC|nr:telomerase-binding protein EST1A-like [Physella acuta]
MAAKEEVVRISYANLEKIVLSSNSGTPESKRKNDRKQSYYNKQQKARRPEQQIYRPGQLRQSKEHKNGDKTGDKDEDLVSPSNLEEESWDSVDLKVNSTDEDVSKASRESSGDVNERDINQRLDDLYIESPPRETQANSKQETADLIPGQDLDEEYATSEKNWRDKGYGKRRGKRPDIQIYVPRARLGDKERKSEERDDGSERSPSSKSEDVKEKVDEKKSSENADEVVVADAAENLRKVQVKNKGGAMKVTVVNESITTQTVTDSSPNISRKDLGTHPARNNQNQKSQKPKEPTAADKQTRNKDIDSKNKDLESKNKNQPRGGGEKNFRQFENSRRGKGRPDTAGSEIQASQDIRKQVPDKIDKPVKSYSKNRRSNSSDSRLKDNDQIDPKRGQSENSQFSSETFPRVKGQRGKGTKGNGRENSNKEGYGAGKSVREGEKFYWGMRRQRTGSISSEASVASNPSNGSFYSGSSDFTEDDEPEHILNWGEEVEKAHLEELARIVHDGARKLTSSLDAYPGFGPAVGTPEAAKKTESSSTLDRQKSVSADEIFRGKLKEGGRTRHRRHRHRKNSSKQGSRDSSVHSSIHGEDGFSERGHRRRRGRLNSQGSQGSYEHHHQSQRSHQKSHDDRRYGDNAGDVGRGNRSGLQVTIGDNNRHVEISRGGNGAGRQRHRSDDKWDPHHIKDYDMEEGEEDWGRSYNYAEDGEYKKEERHNPHRREKEAPPRFRKESGKGKRGGSREENNQHPHDEHRSDEHDGMIKSQEFERRAYPGDQRAIHPAHDASGTRNKGQGRNRQGKGWRRDDKEDAVSYRRPIERAGSLNHDDLSLSQRAKGGGLLRLPSQQQEPPRPHSNPSPAIHADHAHHFYTDSHHNSGSAAQGSNTRGPPQGKRHLFDPKNPTKPIIIPDATPPLRSDDGEKKLSPSPGSGLTSSSPDSPQTHQYPAMFYPPDFHPMYRFRPPMPPFTTPFMAGFPGTMPPHMFFRYPRMPQPDLSFYNSSDIDPAASRSQYRMMAEQILRDSLPFDSQLGNILSRRPNSEDSFRMVNQIRAELQNRLEQVIISDVEVANKHNVEQLLWKSVYYQVIEAYRKRIGEESQDVSSKQRLMDVLDEGARFFENLLKKLQSTYEFDLEAFSDGNRPMPEVVGRNVKLALLSAQRVMMFLGDIARYKEQASDTTNYGKARHWYLKAQRIHPRNGRPYNQLAILAVYTRRKLDAVYYYMRSLAASNPILTARESLMSLFDEVRRKVDAVEKKRFEERKNRMALRRKHHGRGPRVEIWVLPDGTSTQDRVDEAEYEDDLSSLSAIELNKRFVLTYLNVHGKLFTKINFEVFAESSSLMLQEFQTLIQHSPCVFSSTRFLQLMVINMFSVDNTALKDESLEENCRSVLQEHAVEIALEMFGLLVKRSCELLEAQVEAQEKHKSSLAKEDHRKSDATNEDPLPSNVSRAESCLSLGEDLHLMLPALKTWVDWMMCHPYLWNPQPLNRPPDLGPQIDVWKNLATFCDLLNEVETKQGCLIREPQEGFEPVILHEDMMLAGFVPMLSAPQEIFYVDSKVDKAQAEDWLRIEKLRLFGEYLCGVEPPMLAFNVESGKYYSVAPSPTRSEEKLVGEDKSGLDSADDSDDVIIEHGDSDVEISKDTKDDIEMLKAKKAELNRQREEMEKNKENMEAILDSHRHTKIELEICPIFLIPDTNCFIDHFSTLKKILLTKKYTLVVPLVVINELDGLAKGARDKQYDSPDHARMVKTQAVAAVEFLEAEFEVKNPNLRAQTAKGSILETISFRSEESDGTGINDDIILNCCLHYCKDMAREFMPKDKDHPVRLYREVVLLTDDRNLRLKAHTCNIPVKDVPNFKRWSKIT